MTSAVFRGKSDAGNPHILIDGGEVASYPAGRTEGVTMRGTKPRRGSRFYKRLMVAFGAIVLACAEASAATYVVPAGETRRMGAYGSSPVAQQTDGVGNGKGDVLDLREGATVKLVYEADNFATIWATIVATNGVATVDLSEFGAKSLTLSSRGGFVTSGDGEGGIRIKGARAIELGGYYADTKWYNSNVMLRAPDFEFEDPAGVINLVGRTTVEKMPTNCTWTIGNPCEITLWCNEPVFPDLDVVPFTMRELVIANPAALKPGQLVTMTNGTVRFEPSYPKSVSATPIPCGGTLTNPILLSGSTLIIESGMGMTEGGKATNGVPVVLASSVTGTGSVRLEKYANSTELILDVTGSFEQEGGIVEVGSGCELRYGAAPADVQDVRLAASGTVSFAPVLTVSRLSRLNGEDTSSVLKIGRNQSVSVGSVGGILHVLGAGKETGSVLTLESWDKGLILDEDGSVTLRYGALGDQPEQSVLSAVNDTLGTAVHVLTTGGTTDVSRVSLSHAYTHYTVTDGSVIAGAHESLVLRTEEGVRAEIQMPSKDGAVSLNGRGGSFDVTANFDLSPIVDIWFDMSRTDTMFRPGYGTKWAEQWKDKCQDGDPKYPCTDQVVDWRNPSTRWRLYQTANIVNSDADGADHWIGGIVPYLDPDGPNGHSFLSAEKQTSARIEFYDDTHKTIANATYPLEGSLVVMACKPAKAGPLLGTTTKAFDRGGKGIDRPVALSDAHDIWLDGVKITPSTTKYDADRWFIVSVDITDLKLTVLGRDGDNSNGGSWAYGEIMIFTHKVSDTMRVTAEKYLAEKWAVTAYRPGAIDVAELYAGRVVASGTGTISMPDIGETELEGSFAGTVRLNGGTLKIADRRLPWSETDLPREGRVGWYDPDLTNRAVKATASYARGTEITTMWDRDGGEVGAVGGRFLYGADKRYPALDYGARGLGPARHWLNFNNIWWTDEDWEKYEKTKEEAYNPDGNNFRTKIHAEGRSFSGDAMTPIVTRTGFIVQDSVLGGGMPVGTDIKSGGRHATNRKYFYDDPIITRDQSAALANGKTYLNGERVELPTTTGFTGKPELYSFVTASDFNACYFACYENTSSRPEVGEIMGEILLYSTVLDDEVREGIESYLMNKWLGTLPAGFADSRQATIDGIGAVIVPDAARCPQFASTFTGSVTLGGESGSFDFTIDPDVDTVENALNVPNATLTLPSACMGTVRFTKKPRVGRERRVWTLVDCAGYAGGDVAWTVLFADGTSYGKAVIRKSEDGRKITVEIEPSGLILLVN